jgi:hypothetical protein
MYVSFSDATPLLFHGFGIPKNFIESFDASMQVILAVVQRELILLSIKRKFPFGDPISITPDYRPEIGFVVYISLKRIIPQHNIGKIAAPVFSIYIGYNGSVIDNLDPHSRVIFE